MGRNLATVFKSFLSPFFETTCELCLFHVSRVIVDNKHLWKLICLFNHWNKIKSCAAGGYNIPILLVLNHY